MGVRYLVLILFFLSGAYSASAQVYKWVDEDGRMHYSDKPPASELESTHQTTPLKKQVLKTKNIPSYPQETVTFKVRKLLAKKDFNQLNAYLAKLQKKIDENIVNEHDLYTAFYAFRIDDKSYEPLFNKWVETTPDNYFAYLARARYYYGLGWMVRGHAWASETKKEQMKEMSEYFNKAMLDMATVFKKNNQSLVAYTTLINIANTFGKDTEAAAATKKALEIQPASFVVRNTYLNSIKPRWGGSYKQMAMFIEYSLRYVDDNPKLKCLAGEVLADKASMSFIQNAPNSAEISYTQALSFAECAPALYKRGKVRYRLKKYIEALEDFDRAIEIEPEVADYYYWRAQTYISIKNNKKAMLDIQYAVKLDPYDKKINASYERLLVREGYSLRHTKNKSYEIDKYNAALRINPNNADTYARRARAYIAQEKNDLALKDLDKAIKLEPNEIEHYVLIDFVLAKSRAWKKIIPYWDKFIALNPNSGRAYRNRGGTYYRMGDMKSAKRDAKRSAELGDLEGKDIYKRFFGGR